MSGPGDSGKEKGGARPAIQSTAALARYLGISRWTVSRVLNGHPGVRPETAERVRRAMRESGFEPNPFARSLRGGRTRTIGVCIQEMDSPSLSRKVADLQELFRERDYRCLLELTNRNRGLEETVVRHFLNLRVDGIVGIGSRIEPGSELPSEIVAAGVPMVLVDPESALDFPVMEVDRVEAAEAIARLLWEEGHRSFGFAGFDPEYPYSARRLEGFSRFLEGREHDRAWSLFEPGVVRHDIAYGDRLAGLVAAREERPSALVAVNDRVAIGLISGLRRRGWRIPEDLAVTGHDDLEIAPHFDPPLTTVDQRVRNLMERASAGLVAWIEEGEKPPARTLIPTEVRARESHRLHPARVRRKS